MTTQWAVEVDGLLKSRRARTIGPLTLALPEGHIIALVGQNGAGKSTLLNLMMQLIHPDGGGIRWFGSDYQGGVLPLEVRRSIAYVPEKPAGEENYWNAEEAAGFRSHWYPSWDQNYFLELAGKFEVPLKGPLRKMSKGERRKFEIAAALAAQPRLLLLDEPSSGLDPFAWKTMIGELQAYMDRSEATILISTHIVEEVRRLADYIVLMHKGKLLGMAEKDSLYETWSELWLGIHGEEELAELAAELPELRDLRMEGPGLAACISRNNNEMRKRLADYGVQVIRSRSLELDEILELWTQGLVPDLV